MAWLDHLQLGLAAPQTTAAITIATLAVTTLFGLLLMFARRVSARFTATIATHFIALVPLGVLIWNTAYVVFSNYGATTKMGLPPPGDFDSAMIIYAAGFAIFHILADLVSGLRDAIDTADERRREYAEIKRRRRRPD